MASVQPVHLYQYPKCSTCKKALRWLDDHGVKYTKSDLVAQPIPFAKMKELYRRSGLALTRFFNTSGESYRAGSFKERLRTLSDDDAIRALAEDGKLVKRPLLDTGEAVLVGFDPDAFESAPAPARTRDP